VTVRLSFRSQNVPPPPPKPLHKHRYIGRHLVTAHFFQLTKRFCHCVLWLSLALRFTVGWSSNTGLWSENVFFTRKVVSGVLYPYNSDKSNAQKSEIPTNIDVYIYRRAYRLASCSVGFILRGCGVVKCNTLVNLPRVPSNTGNFISSYIVTFDLFCSHCERLSHL
jgi:hypothetical protein